MNSIGAMQHTDRHSGSLRVLYSIFASMTYLLGTLPQVTASRFTVLGIAGVLFLTMPIQTLAQEETAGVSNRIADELQHLRVLFETLNHDNTLVIWSTLAATVAGFVIAGLAVYLTVHNTRALNRQLEYVEADMEIKLRPILARSLYSNDKSYRIDSNQTNFSINIKNVGTVIATDILVQLRSMTSEILHEQSLSDIEKEFEKCNINFTRSASISLQPGESTGITFMIDCEEYEEIITSDKFHFQFKIDYWSPKKIHLQKNQ